MLLWRKHFLDNLLRRVATLTSFYPIAKPLKADIFPKFHHY